MCGSYRNKIRRQVVVTTTASIDVNVVRYYQFINDGMSMPILGAWHTSEVDEEKGIILYVWTQFLSIMVVLG
jgi:hypothetical protein